MFDMNLSQIEIEINESRLSTVELDSTRLISTPTNNYIGPQMQGIPPLSLYVKK